MLQIHFYEAVICSKRILKNSEKNWASKTTNIWTKIEQFISIKTRLDTQLAKKWKNTSFGCRNYPEWMARTRINARRYSNRDNRQLPRWLSRLSLSQEQPRQKPPNKRRSRISGRRQNCIAKIKRMRKPRHFRCVKVNINVLFELGRLEGHFIHLKNFARNINLHFIFVFQKTNHLIHALTTTVPICDWFMWLVYVPICHCSYMLTGFYMMETLVVKALSNTATLL